MLGIAGCPTAVPDNEIRTVRTVVESRAVLKPQLEPVGLLGCAGCDGASGARMNVVLQRAIASASSRRETVAA